MEGRDLKRAREDRQLTQAQVGAAMGATRQWVSLVEKMETVPETIRLRYVTAVKDADLSRLGSLTGMGVVS
jgi:transcriptional regulator with XRE-family HTH domain